MEKWTDKQQKGKIPLIWLFVCFGFFIYKLFPFSKKLSPGRSSDLALHQIKCENAKKKTSFPFHWLFSPTFGIFRKSSHFVFLHDQSVIIRHNQYVSSAEDLWHKVHIFCISSESINIFFSHSNQLDAYILHFKHVIHLIFNQVCFLQINYLFCFLF